MAGERFDQGPFWDNLGISYSAGTLTIHGSDGRDLSTSNPAVVVLPSKASYGQFVRYNITANQSFQDAAGTSDIVGNTFGTTASTAWGNDMPFYIYASSNDAEDTCVFSICRQRDRYITSASGSSGDASSATADSQFSHFFLEDVTLTLYDSNPCVCIGSLIMQKDATDDWTVQAFSGYNTALGIGRYADNLDFEMVAGQNGAASSNYLFSNGGTAPTFTTQKYAYSILPGNNVKVSISLQGDGGTDGSGAVLTQVVLPMLAKDIISTDNILIGSCGYVNEPTNAGHLVMAEVSRTSPLFFLRENSANYSQNGDFTNGDRSISIGLDYLPAIA